MRLMARRLAAIGLGWLLVWTGVCAAQADEIEYNRDIRAILSDKCFRCHGPDSATRQADLRLDRREEAVADRAGVVAIVPGRAAESELYLRVSSTDADLRMPPIDSGQTLTADEIETLRLWIDAGAEYQPHWSFIRPKAAPLPDGAEGVGARDAIDAFVRAELAERDLAPSPEADRATLLRRVTLDLIGLPPTMAELDAFLGDESRGAYEKVVDRLLSSPHYGERLALDWLDAARYADSAGFYTDEERRVWPWRDWVIRAFNQDMPFDQFTVEQLAGDLLPDATLDQKVATGFNRLHMVSDEGGIIEEEYRTGYVVDRVDTTSTVWLGLSVGCARCHDHKYDPITQREYYELFAYFNNIVEKGKATADLTPPPSVALPTQEQERMLADLVARERRCIAKLKVREPELAAGMARWEPQALERLAELPEQGKLVHVDFDGGTITNCGSLSSKMVTVGELVFEPGVMGGSSRFNATQHVEFDGPPSLDRERPFSISLWINPAGVTNGCVLSKMSSTVEARGFELTWYKARPYVHLIHQWGRDAIEIYADRQFRNNEWRHLAITYDGSGRAAGLCLYIDGELNSPHIRRDALSGSIDTSEPWRIAFKGMGVGFEGAIDDLRIHDHVLSGDQVEAAYWRSMLEGALATPTGERTKQQTDRLRTYYIDRFADEESRALTRELANLKNEELAIREAIAATPVMEEMSQPRESTILVRGQYDQAGDVVTASVPAALGKIDPRLPANRLGLARWLVDERNPLTSRVIVNRYWQLVFGDGLVRTANDFGLQGELPSHAALLDWLAVDFVQANWNVKRLLKEFVMSQTYRQSSRFSPELLKRDLENRWLARGPSYRLPPELIRDQALSLAGLLSPTIGGPSVRPYQPAGIWEAVSYNGEQSYVVGQGDDLYRRGMYTYWKRQAPPPFMLAFDAPTREVCSIRRARTNTPLQALVLMNDVTFVEAARGLASQVLRDFASDPREGARFAFRRVSARWPSESELETLLTHHAAQVARYRQEPRAAAALIAEGDSRPEATCDATDLAAWTMTCGVLLNLDETVTQH